ncbi:MAG: chromosomal replication initiator protein DnaA [Candidatus Levybacteria bacterium]|nr:chromosomal replication initiator protein DnaA [Candidatus Levybacteria bacterium]
MTKENQELWKAILGEIETEVSRAIFLTLFKHTFLISFENGVMTIAASSVMIVDLLQKRYYQIIKKTVDKHTGLSVKIIFVPKTIFPEIKTDDKDGPLFAGEEKSTIIGHLPRVRKEYTFQTMAVSSSNQLAYVSAQTVAKKIGTAYNPLFIYGPVGVGKTHLIHAIANKVFEESQDKKIFYITSEGFTNEVVEAIRTNDTARMKKKFRNVDILAIDDVQFVAGKERVQEELFHTFNTLIDKGAQVVLSSDRPPSEIKKLEKRLSSRFSGGLTVDIEPPDFELRTAILLIKAKKYDFPLTIDAAKKIAEHSQDARKLEGILLRIMTEAQSIEGELSNNIIEKVLYNNNKTALSYYHPDEIINNVCSFYKIKPTQIKGVKRDALLVRARQIAMYILRSRLNLSYVEIGNILGGRDHTTIMHGVEKVEGLLSGELFSDEVNKIISTTGGNLVD